MRLALALALSLPSGVATGQEGPALAPRHLDWGIEVRYETQDIAGRAEWTLENVGSAPIDSFPVQVGRLMTISRISVDGATVPFSFDVVTFADWPTRQVALARARFPKPIPVGGHVRIETEYAGPLVPYTETGMGYVRDHVSTAFTILRWEALAFPQIMGPSLAALRNAPRSDFTYRMSVTAPSDLTVATGAPGIPRSAGEGRTTWSFDQRAPVPFLNVAIAPYEVVEAGGLRVFHFPEDAAGARDVLDAMTDAIRTYEAWFGPIDDTPALHVIEIPEGSGSQASLTGGIIQTADAFRDPTLLPHLYHELAHLWHPMDLDIPAPRWNEGLATFLQHRVASERDDPGSLDDRMRAIASVLAERWAERPPAAPMVDYGAEELTDLSYRTGAVMFYILYRTLGETRFDELLAEWFRERRAQGSTTADFAALFRERAPAAGRVLDDWLFGTAGPRRLAEGAGLEELIARYR